MTTQTEAILARIREVCEDRSKFIKPTHGTCCTCQRCGHPNDYECICLDEEDLHLEHLLRAIGEEIDITPCSEDSVPQLEMHAHFGKTTYYNLTLTVEQNLEQNEKLREFIYSLICKV